MAAKLYPQPALRLPTSLGIDGLGMADHHEAFNNMLQMNGMTLMHQHLGVNGAHPPQPPPVDMNGANNSQSERNGSTTPSNSAPQHNSSTGGGNSSGRSSPNEDPAATKLFVGGLSWQTSPEKLKEYFGMFGTVTDVLIMKDPLTQRSRGFGFITFSEPDTVEKVLKVPIHTLDGKKIDPKHATPKNRPKQSNRTKKIFVGGVSQDTSAEEVKAYFSQFGKVEETVMLMDQQTKRHRGFGFVTFENEDVVDRICEIHFHTIKNKKVECKKAQPKEVVAPGLLLGKRVMVMGGMRMAAPTPVTSAGQLVAAQAHVQAAAAAAAAQNAAAAVQNAAAVGYGKLFSGYPSLAGYRYAPYPVAAMPATAPPTTPAQQTQAAGLNPSTGIAPPTNPYQAYSLANVDMSSFQGVDWSSMYGMGLYV